MTVMNDIQETLKCYLEIIGFILGLIIQFIIGSSKQPRLFKFILFLMLSSIFSALFIVSPLLEYLHIESVKIASSAYALSSVISINIISFITAILPRALQQKALTMLGVDDDIK